MTILQPTLFIIKNLHLQEDNDVCLKEILIHVTTTGHIGNTFRLVF